MLSALQFISLKRLAMKECAMLALSYTNNVRLNYHVMNAVLLHKCADDTAIHKDQNLVAQIYKTIQRAFRIGQQNSE